MGTGGNSPLILNLGSKWRGEVDFTPDSFTIFKIYYYYYYYYHHHHHHHHSTSR